MIFRSNVSAPDLQPQFAATTVCHPRPWSMGHDALSDVKYDSNCTFMLHDEAALLYECASRMPGTWVDIGCRMMWTTAHIAKAGCTVYAVEPEFYNDDFRGRALANVGYARDRIKTESMTSMEFFTAHPELTAEGVCIDGNHDAPEPLNDARRAAGILNDDGVIILHDFWGQPIRDAAEFLMDEGFKCRVYNTPNGMAVCWRGNSFSPPEHRPDPAINWQQIRKCRAPEFDFSRCS